MNDFFANQQDARRRSGRLILLFGLAVIGVVLAVYLVAAATRAWLLMRHGAPAHLWDPQLFFWNGVVILGFIAAASLWKIHELGGGGAVIAAALGGKLVSSQTQDPQERLLRNVVEEMAIASGMPVPDLYKLESERGINAFAAGLGINDAAICVTRGAIELLTRDELQGVVAHEFSHILNGDMLLNLRLIGWLNGILVVTQGGEIMLRGLRLTSSRTAGAIFLVASALYAVGYIGYFFGQLIKSAVSRQREYLGDASAVQFTRYPAGLAGALKKIGGLATGSRLDHPRAAEASHMFFGNGLEQAWLHALDSHPPLLERIRRLEPRFDGRFPQMSPLPSPPPAEVYTRSQPVKATPEPVSVLSGTAVAALLAQVGDPLQEHIDLARRLIDGLPKTVLLATRDSYGACALIYSLLLDRDPAIRGRQEEILYRREKAAMVDEIRRLAHDLAAVAPQIRLPLLDLSLPALRTLSTDQFLRLKENTEALAAADGRESLFEFTLRYLLVRHLEPRYLTRPAQAVQIYGIRGVQQECSCILTSLARVGAGNEAEARAAFARGEQVLQESKTEFSFLPAAQCRVSALESAFARLEGTSPQIKRRLLAACLECLVHDGVVKVEEAELFRAIADALGCPVPPALAGESFGVKSLMS